MTEPSEQQDLDEQQRGATTRARADLADAQERLADERERLADERERTADEQEVLADERERLADLVERRADGAQRVDDPAAWAQEVLARADARVERALAEQARARALVERVAAQERRTRAGIDRERAGAAAAGLDGDAAAWASDRRDFVAADREAVADDRDEQADARDELAHERGASADERDRAARAREVRMARADEFARWDGSRGAGVEAAAAELDAVRESARRQRSAADQARRRATADRALATQRRRDLRTDLDPYGRLATELSTLTAQLFATDDLLAVAERVAALSTECIPGAVASGVTFFEGVRPLTHLATDEIAKQLDAHQLAHHDGPIAACVEHGETELVSDLGRDERWPSFRAVAAKLGVAGVIATELVVRRASDWQSLGVLTIYAEEAGALADEDRDAAALFAAHLSIVAAFDRDRHDVVRREAALHRALGSRDVIGQAKGILMERQRLTAGDAYDILRRSSQQLNLKLSEVAERLTESGELPS